MERQQGNGIYALIGAAAVVVVAALVGVLVWDQPAANGSNGQGGSAPRVESTPPSKPQESSAPMPGTSKATPTEEPKESPKGKPANGNANGKPQPDKTSGAKPEGDKPQKAEPRAKPEEPVVKSDKPPVEDKGKPDGSAPPPGHVSTPDQGGGGTAGPVVATPPASGPTPSAGPAPAGKPDGKTIYPSFDHVRIEPNGENVFAGRVAPGATVEMIRDGQVYARAVADTSGLFALTAPPLPAGASQIYLQSIAPDGTRESSRDSVTVMISHDNAKRPLVALTSPDKPTVVLSNPDSPDTRKPEGTENGGKTPGPAAVRPVIKIVSVEARDGGRLFVSGHAAPGASVRLYLNGTMVAPGGADSEGNLSFTIARGMAAGSYLVRLDDVDPVSGQLKSKAEVTFTVPDLAAYHASSGDAVPAEGAAAPAAGAMRKATVERGDSLWSISERYYGSGYLYLEVYDANMRKIKDPNTIYPGQVLTLPPLEVPKDK